MKFILLTLIFLTNFFKTYPKNSRIVEYLIPTNNNKNNFNNIDNNNPSLEFQFQQKQTLKRNSKEKENIVKTQKNINPKFKKN